MPSRTTLSATIFAAAFLYATCLEPRRTPAQTIATQAHPASPVIFDVVSIRPMKPDDPTPTHITNSAHNGNFKATNVNLKALLEVAYDIPDLRMYGGPDWASSEKFSLEAKADSQLDQQLAALPTQQGKQIKRSMLAALLADRFQLKVHTEARELPIYALLVAKGGPKLGAANSGQDTAPTAGDRIVVQPGGNSLEVLAYELSWRLGRPVLDRTGLQDKQALKLTFEDDTASAADSSAPSVFTAIQEQLGLKLEPSKAPVPVLILDHAERPTPN